MPAATVSVSMSDVHRVALDRLAELRFEGSRSLAVRHILDRYLGVAVERAELELGQNQTGELGARVQVTRWAKPKLDVALIGYIAGLVRAGNMPEVACNLAGVTPQQRSSWMKKGRNDRREGKQSLAADFVTAIERSEAECEAEDIKRLREHGKQVWTALAWRLERQYPDRYAQRKRMDTKVQHSLMPMIDYDRLNAQETRTLVYLLRKASPESSDDGVGRFARPAVELIPEEVLDAVDAEWSDVTHEIEARALEEAPALEKPQP